MSAIVGNPSPDFSGDAVENGQFKNIGLKDYKKAEKGISTFKSLAEWPLMMSWIVIAQMNRKKTTSENHGRSGEIF